GSDPGVDLLEHHVIDAEDRPRDLTGDRDEPLPDLDGGELEGRHTVDEATPCGREVVEPLGVHEVLHRHAVPDAAHDVTDVGGASGAAGEVHDVAVGPTDRLVGERQRHRL